MKRHDRFELALIGIEILEDVVLDVLTEARDWGPPLGKAEVAYPAAFLRRGIVR